MSAKDIPSWLRHKPIVSVDYKEKDAYAGDAMFLSIGKSTWNPEDVSAKIWRWAENGERWSRQSEELPLWRVLDLAKLLIATITGQHSSLGEVFVSETDRNFLQSYLQDNMELYIPRMNEISDLLNTSHRTKSIKTPNIFSFATSELSQDAILSWLIKWADDQYKEEDPQLCKLGKSMISLLTNLRQDDIHTVDVGRQWCNIDIWAEINDDAFLMIEDKTGTSIHDDQLERYKEIVEGEYQHKRDKLFFSYVKTGNEALQVERRIQEKGYKTINRKNLLVVLNEYEGKNPLVIDFRRYLQEIEDATNRFKELPAVEWRWYEWQGFYKELERHIDVENWDYVANPAGGFIGLWWNFISNDEVRMYLQFEERKLCVKIEYEGEENRSEVRWKYHNRLMKACEESGLSIDRPLRFGAGTYMTIGVVPTDEVFGGNKIDMNELVRKLKTYERIVQRCMVSDE